MDELDKAGESDKMRRRWVAAGLMLLEAGKGHLGVVNFLIREGMSAEKARRLSAIVFSEARLQLRKKQRVHRIFAWVLISGSFVVPFVILYFSGGFFFFTLLPAVLGIMILYRLPNPRLIPGLRPVVKADGK